MTGNEEHYIQEAFKSNWIAPLGPNVDAFEERVASYVGVGHALAVSSGTAAIHLALRVLEVKPGDTVFCPSFTFVATANPILYEGAQPVFIDSEEETWNMSPRALNKAFKDALLRNKLPKAVIVVNLYGQSAKMDEITAICNRYGVPVIEDAAESLGAEFQGKKSGTFGKFGVFSFNGNKIITTSGGGMLVSDDREAIEKAKFLSTQAKDPAPYYLHHQQGYNYRLSNVLAGIGLAQMEVLDERVQQKRKIFDRYKTNLKAMNFMPEIKNSLHTRWLTTALLPPGSRMGTLELVEALSKEQIEARPVWKPLHTQPLFKGCKYYTHEKDRSISDELFKRGLCLPSGTGMTEFDQERVIETVRTMLKPKVQLEFKPASTLVMKDDSLLRTGEQG
ncbi:aminotransferase class I/II-fold pyridoxal phosphate-dependent enzyme [Halobacillus yeomjeoni]|uniref:Aminotransferase class I/II-fold pyridoxal phosphate-dependent enzyme n=1 Tax=Halobacillus yeomjeoni TaxID=311194 RepID=A0A931HVZ1_9BACI|nr:aminotransferase class I/II-fold pyridoxal phosphate-dependent enzyme [Halobacillus yeomjeoni]